MRSAHGPGGAVGAVRLTPDGALTLGVVPLIAELGDAETARAELGRVRNFGADLGDEGVLRPYRAALGRLRGTPCLENATFLDHWAHRLEVARVLALTGDAPAALARPQGPGGPRRWRSAP